MPIPDEYKAVWTLLADRAPSPLTRWRESGRDGEYAARAGMYSVLISINRLTEMFTKTIQSPVTIQLLLPEGLEIGRFEVRPDEAEYLKVRAFYDRVSANAAKKADILREIEQALRTAG